MPLFICAVTSSGFLRSCAFVFYDVIIVSQTCDKVKMLLITKIDVRETYNESYDKFTIKN